MIDLRTEAPITLSGAARQFPPNRRNRPVTLSCVLRWVLDGVRLPDGQLVRLEAVRCAGRWLTSLAAIQRFVERQTPRFDGEPAPTPRSDSRRQRAAEQAAKRLEAIGI